MKLLLTKGFLSVHTTGCECAGYHVERTEGYDKHSAILPDFPPPISRPALSEPNHVPDDVSWSKQSTTFELSRAVTEIREGEELRWRDKRLAPAIKKSIMHESTTNSSRKFLTGEGPGDSEAVSGANTDLLLSTSHNNNNNALHPSTHHGSKGRKRRGGSSGNVSSASARLLQAAAEREQRLSAAVVAGDVAANLVAQVQAAAAVKAERLSPGSSHSAGEAPPLASGSRSGSPESAGRTRTTPNNPAYLGAPPERGSPGGAGAGPPGHLKQMEQMMNRNYSDFMRSLAAKYNNSNPNDYFSSQRNGFLSNLDPRFSFSKSSAAFPSLGNPAAASGLGSRDDPKVKAAAEALSLFHQPNSSSNSTPGSGAQSSGLLAAAAGLTHPLNFPLIDMSSTQALLSMVRSASAQNASQIENYLKSASSSTKRTSSDSPLILAAGLCSSPLDLSAATSPSSSAKRPRFYPKSESLLLEPDEATKTASVSPKPLPRSGSASSASSEHSVRGGFPGQQCMSLCTEKPCQPEGQSVAHWTVDDVCSFVESIDLCAEYVQSFRDQAIDGSALPLLTEEHLTNALGLKLGPALKLRSVLAHRLGHCALCLHCVHCHGASSGSPSQPQTTPQPPPAATTPGTATSSRSEQGSPPLPSGRTSN